MTLIEGGKSDLLKGMIVIGVLRLSTTGLYRRTEKSGSTPNTTKRSGN